MSSLHSRRRRTLLLFALAVSVVVGAVSALGNEKAPLVISDADIGQCEPVQRLGALKEELEAEQSPIMRQVFAWLFPFGPGWNSSTSPLSLSYAMRTRTLSRTGVLTRVA
ncbi:hypothetical protein TRAPUB_6531 [Trametes pubescens]|uniref:Uncharacterized protein n=1 Tax=Trametes pubescens TaxID=154538 RepID=A0A1M2W6W0_TRAPU|nr:hypothetical protein TRAPUB_6531 [Trametes pubescens]